MAFDLDTAKLLQKWPERIPTEGRPSKSELKEWTLRGYAWCEHHDELVHVGIHDALDIASGKIRLH